MFEPEDLTPIFVGEPVREWYRFTRLERFDLRMQPGCYMSDPKNVVMRCVRARGHLGPHCHSGHVWDPYEGEKRIPSV